jgi:Tat protein translocase TatB subunit
MFGIGFGELVFLAILALIVFGPRRIPEIARTVGRFLNQVRQATKGLDQEVRQWMDGVESPQTWLQEDTATRKLPPEAGRPLPLTPPTAGPPPDPAEETGPAPPTLPG